MDAYSENLSGLGGVLVGMQEQKNHGSNEIRFIRSHDF
jgi:hypothetical protein